MVATPASILAGRANPNCTGPCLGGSCTHLGTGKSVACHATGHHAIQNTFLLQPPANQIHGVSIDFTIAEFNPALGNPNKTILYGFSNIYKDVIKN
jgi:hypothetical protein